MTKPLRQPACHARHERAGIVTRGSAPPEHVRENNCPLNSFDESDLFIYLHLNTLPVMDNTLNVIISEAVVFFKRRKCYF
ncbi:MAG: hypothetical protein KKF96_03135 [Proteobacteria bacterium]|nr:hypothetical protein [Pseudomonadota bacterium]